jgi:hypothetical protein
MKFTNKLDADFKFKQLRQLESCDTQELTIPAHQHPSPLLCTEVTTALDSNRQLFISISEKINLDELILVEHNLSNSEVLTTLERWDAMLKQHSILVIFTETLVDHRRRYRFLAEVFFKMLLPVHPIDMQFCFLYDTDESARNEYLSQQKVNGIIRALLNHEHVESIEQLNKRVRLNNIENLSEPELYYLVNRHKQRCHHIFNRTISVLTNKIRGNRLIYNGIHETNFCFDDYCVISKGRWQLEMISEQGTWKVVDIQVEGVNF